MSNHKPRVLFAALTFVAVLALCIGGVVFPREQTRHDAVLDSETAVPELIEVQDAPLLSASVQASLGVPEDMTHTLTTREAPLPVKSAGDMLYALELDGKWGVINGFGETVAEPAYRCVAVLGKEDQLIYAERTSGGAVLYAGDMTRLLSDFSDISLIDGDFEYDFRLFRYREKGKEGLVFADGTKITEAVYHQITGLRPGSTGNHYIEVLSGDGLKGALSPYTGTSPSGGVAPGGEVAPPVFAAIEAALYDPFAFTPASDAWHAHLRYIVGTAQDGARGIYEGEALRFALLPSERVWQYEDIFLIFGGGRLRVLNKYMTVTAEHDDGGYPAPLAPGLLTLADGPRRMMMDTSGNIILPYEEWSLERRGDNIWARSGNLAEIYEFDGSFVRSEPWTDALAEISGNYRLVRAENGLCGLTGAADEYVIPPEYGAITPCGNGWIVTRDGKQGFIDASFALTIPPVNDRLTADFERADVLLALRDGKWRAYTSDGRSAVTYEAYDAIKSGFYGVLTVKKNGKWAFIDHRGNALTAHIYDDAGTMSAGGFTPFMQNGMWGCAGLDGAVACPAVYPGTPGGGAPDMIYGLRYVYGGLFSRYTDS